MTKILTHYDRLGVAQNAPDEVIRGAYKALARKNHPDKNLGNPAATAIMQALNQAYDVLSNPVKRADYDAMLSQIERLAVMEAEAQGRAQRASHAPQSKRPKASTVFLVVAAFAVFFAVFVAYVFGPVSGSTLLHISDTLSATPAKRSTAPATFASRETTPRELAVCIFAAAKTYAVPPSLLLGLLSVESGTAGQKTSAAGHSYDLGPLQINSFWIPELAKAWSVSKETALRRVRDDACVNIGIGAWILQTSLKQTVLDKGSDLRGAIAVYRASAHHSELETDKEYVEKAIKLMELYKPIHGPDDLLEHVPLSPGK